MNLISHFFAAALLLILSWALPAQADVTVAMKAIERGHYATAQRALRKLATQGDARAQNNLAYLYEHGLGLERSYPDALSWYTRAADAGLPDAQYNLATFLHLGRGVSRDYPAAFQWYLKSAQAGFTDAQYMVGEYQREGYVSTKDGALALSWYLKAAKKGHAGAQLMASLIYLTGEGWRSEPAKAAVWAELARLNGEQQAPMLLAQAAKKIRSAELAEAVQQAGICLQSSYRDCPE
jgi:TPR repeat protein